MSEESTTKPIISWTKLPLSFKSKENAKTLTIDQERVLVTQDTQACVIHITTGEIINYKASECWTSCLAVIGKPTSTEFSLMAMETCSYALFDSVQGTWSTFKTIDNVPPEGRPGGVVSKRDGNLSVTWWTSDPQYRDYWSKMYIYDYKEKAWITYESYIYSNDPTGVAFQINDEQIMYLESDMLSTGLGQFKQLPKCPQNGHWWYSFLVDDHTLMIAKKYWYTDPSGNKAIGIRAFSFDLEKYEYTEIFHKSHCTKGTIVIQISPEVFACFGGKTIVSPYKKPGDLVLVNGALLELVDDVDQKRVWVRNPETGEITIISNKFIPSTKKEVHSNHMELFSITGEVFTETLELPETMNSPVATLVNQKQSVVIGDQHCWLLNSE
jgi:hypothetical protein